MREDIKENVTRRSIWHRFCFMIILSIAFGLAEVIIAAVVAFQFVSSLFTGQTNDQLIRFGRNLARYLQQITLYLAFATEEIPFPFMQWPDEPHEEAPVDNDGDPLNDQPETSDEATGQDDEDDEDEADEADEANRAEAPVAENIDRQDDTPEAARDTTELDETDDARADDPKADETTQTAIFADSAAYQNFMGERSRAGGERFVNLLDRPSRLSWLDVGCGTGVFSAVIMKNCDPAALIGIDSSEPQITHAQAELGNEKASFRVADATALPFEVDSFDVAVSSYVLNFVPNKQKMVDEMARVVRPEGTVAISVFDVAGGRQSSHHVWELIGKNDPAFHRAEFEKRGWDITRPDALTAYFENAGLEGVSVDSIENDETYANFDEYWTTMTAMPTSGSSLFVKQLDQNGRQKFQDDLKALLPIEPDGSIKLTSGSWVVRGKVPA